MTEVTQRAKEDRNTVHLANLADLCHLKNADLATHLQNYKWRVVLLEDNVKDECGYMALFAEQGASASQMAAVNFFGHNFPNFWYDWRSARRSFGVHASQHGRRLQIIASTRSTLSRNMDQ